MKIFRFLAAFLIAVTFFSPRANATVIETVNIPGILSAGDHNSNLSTLSTSVAGGPEGTYDYIVSGVMDKHTKLTLTLVLDTTNTGAVLSEDVDARYGSAVGSDAAAHAIAAAQLVLASFTDLAAVIDPVAATYTYTFSILNNTASYLSFVSEILAIIELNRGAACCSSLCLGYEVTAVPLPAAFVLFASGLAGAGGFGFARRKARA